MPPEVAAPATRDDLVGEIHAAVLATDPERGTDLAHVLAEVRRAHPLLPNADAIALARAVTARVAGLGPLEPLLADEAVTDVMVDGHGAVWVERLGELRREAIDARPRRTSTSSWSASSAPSACGPTARRRSPTRACPTALGST